MPAVVEAREMMCAVPFAPDRHTKGTWLRHVAGLFGLTPSKAKKIFYGEVKRIDADTFNRMRERLDALQESAKTRRERLNDLIHLSAELRSDGGIRASAGNRLGEGPRGARGDGSSGSGSQEDRPSSAFIRQD